MSSKGTSDKDRNRIRSLTRMVAKILNPGRITWFSWGSLELCDIPFFSMYAALVIIHSDLVVSGLKLRVKDG
jgi:hypothetical protein